MTYDEIRTKLEARFPDASHQQRDGFTYLDPKCYRDRLNEVFTEGYEFEVFDVVFRAEAIYGSARFDAELDGIIFKRQVVWAEPWMFASGTKDIIKPDVKIQMAVSAALKSLGRELGIALYLYDKNDPIHGKAPAPAAKAPSGAAPANKPAYSGPVGTNETDVWTKGAKYTGQPISAIPNDYFEFMSMEGKTGPVSEASRTILKRRGEEASGRTFDSVTGNDDDGFLPDEVPF